MFRGWAVTQNAGSPWVALNNIDLEKFFFLFLPFKIYIKKYTEIQYTSKQTKKQKEREKKDKT